MKTNLTFESINSILLSQLSQTKGLVMKTNDKDVISFKTIKIAKNTYKLKEQMYNKIHQLGLLWQKLVFQAAYQNGNMLENLLQPIAKKGNQQVNYMLQILSSIGQSLKEKTSITFFRTDFIIDKTNQPKIIQYNTQCVSMASHSENLHQLFTSLNGKAENKPYNKPATMFVDAITQLHQKGIILMVVQQHQINVIDQQFIKILCMQKSIKCQRITLLQLAQHAKIDTQQNLFFKEQLVSIVYYRTGLMLQDFTKDNNKQFLKSTLQIYKKVQNSKAINIPDLRMKLSNLKRIQVELSKKQLYNKFLSNEESQLLKDCLVQNWQFDSMSQNDYEILLKKIQIEMGKSYILKPNKQGGGNNLYDKDCLNKMKSMSVQERNQYILMQKIETQKIKNMVLQDNVFKEYECDYEISVYGILLTKAGQILKNYTQGYLVRAKNSQHNQGGIMHGLGILCACQIIQE